MAEPDAVFAVQARGRALQGRPQRRTVAREIFRVHPGVPILARALADALTRLPAEQLDQPRRHPEPILCDVPVVDAFGNRPADQRVALFAAAQLGLAARQLAGAFVELASELRDRLLGIGYRLIDRRGHASAPARNRTSSGKIMRGMVLLAQAGAMLEELRTSINDDIPLAFHLLTVGRRTGGVAAPVERKRLFVARSIQPGIPLAGLGPRLSG